MPAKRKGKKSKGFKSVLARAPQFSRAQVIIFAVVVVAIFGVFLKLYSQADTPLGPIVGYDSKCLDNLNSKPVNYNRVDLWDCNGTGAQKWSVHTAGPIVNANGFCIDVYHGGTYSGALTYLYRCDNNASQNWTASATTHTIVNNESKLCLAVQNSSTVSGTPLVVATCDGSADQQWDVTAMNPATPSPSASMTPVPKSNSGGSSTVTTTNASCSGSTPTASTNSLYPLQKVVNFTGSTLPSDWNDYGNEVQSPAGYVAANHAVFVPGTGLELKGYPDSVSTAAGVGGVTGASGDIWGSGSTAADQDQVVGSGGFDVCFSMSAGNWQNVHLVLISWPSYNNWDLGENDFFEGNPQSMKINVHEIGSSPATNVYQGSWPSSLATGTHLISTRWDPINGYRFYLDGSLVATAPVGGNITTPAATTAHQLAIQLQDTTESSTSTETATIYWTASYGYSN